MQGETVSKNHGPSMVAYLLRQRLTRRRFGRQKHFAFGNGTVDVFNTADFDLSDYSILFVLDDVFRVDFPGKINETVFG